MKLDAAKIAILKRKAEKEARRHAKGEPVHIEISESAWYVVTSELGMYRIWDAYSCGGRSTIATKGHSPTFGHYVCIEAPHLTALVSA